MPKNDDQLTLEQRAIKDAQEIAELLRKRWPTPQSRYQVLTLVQTLITLK
jgi:hypothetical protein